MLAKLKSKIGLNLFALLGYLAIGFLLYICFMQGNFPTIGIFIYTFMFGCFVGLSLLIYIIELVVKHKVGNNIILKNNHYNIIWLVGFISSSLFTLFFIFVFGAEIMHILGLIE